MPSTVARSLHLLVPAVLALSACSKDPDDTVTAGESTSAADSTGTTDAADTTADPSPTEPDTTTSPGTSTDATTDPTTDATTDPTPDPTATTTTDATTGGGVADCGFDPGLAYARDALIYQLESDDGATCVWLKRRDDSEPDVIYKAVPYTLLELKAGHAGAVAHVTDPAMLTWESTHHNWEDVATATDGAVRYRLEDWYSKDGAFIDSFGLYAFDADTDGLLWGPVTLRPFAP